MPQLRDLLRPIPDADLPLSAEVQEAIGDSARYLASDAAVAHLARDTYWPKWDSPWWHMVLLFELGEARRIPEAAVRAMVAGLDALPVKIFPIVPDDIPPGVDPYSGSSCHCALGCISQVLVACGVDLDAALPWARPWFLRYQMADGGLNCDSDAYTVAHECPSSMVGTVPSLEAMLLGDHRTWSAEQQAFVDRAAGFLVGRELRKGSHTVANAGERTSAERWAELCFPRFYLYDVLRGASALVRWAELREATIPLEAVEPVARHLAEAFPDGVVRLGRRSTDGVRSRAQGADGTWIRQAASRFPLLDVTSGVGDPSPTLTRQWAAVRRSLVQLDEAGRIA